MKKQFIYEVDPHYFNDTTGRGVGDIKGLIEKVEYFEFMGVDALILKNVLASNDPDKIVDDFKQVNSLIGTAEDLKQLAKITKKKGITLLLEISLGVIQGKSNLLLMPSSEDIASKLKKEDLIIDSSESQEIKLEWNSKQIPNHFAKIVEFWYKHGIGGFIFKDFEFLVNRLQTNPMGAKTLKKLVSFYRQIKEIDDRIVVIGRTNILEEKSRNMYIKGQNKVFDLFLSNVPAFFGTDKKYGNDLIAPFRSSELASFVNYFSSVPEKVLMFGSSEIGRIVPRWGQDGYKSEVGKLLNLLLMLQPSSFGIFYGDEINVINIGLSQYDDFRDLTMHHRLRKLQSENISEAKFMESQILLNKINSHNIMPWDGTKNGGFSKANRTINLPPYDYKTNNVKEQFTNKNSTLWFVKMLSEFYRDEVNSKFFEQAEFSSRSHLSGLIIYKFTTAKRTIQVLANLTNSSKRILNTYSYKNYDVVISNYSLKQYVGVPTRLNAFEAIVVEHNKIKKPKSWLTENQKVKSKFSPKSN